MSPVAGTQQYGPSTSSARDTVTTGHQHAVPPPHPQPLPLPLPCCCCRQPPPPPAALMPSQAACVRAAVDGVPALLQPLEAHRLILSGGLRGALASRPRRWSPASPQHAQAGTGREASRGTPASPATSRTHRPGWCVFFATERRLFCDAHFCALPTHYLRTTSALFAHFLHFIECSRMQAAS